MAYRFATTSWTQVLAAREAPSSECRISSVAVSPDGRWIASASQDGTIRLWPMP